MSVQKGMVKTVSADVWAQIIDLLVKKGKHVMLVGGPDDVEVIEIIRQKTTGFEDFYGKTKSLKDLAILIGKAEQFICSDSAPLHVAVAMKTRTYAIFGPTDDKKLIPQSDIVTAIKVEDKCPIKPCLWEHRQTTCENLSCLKITAEDVVAQL
jgi:heptosyltransferase-2/heptosyltransferase-3